MTVYSINLHFSVIPGYVAPFSNTLGGHSQKLLKEDAKDDVTQNGIIEKSKQLVARLNELQKLFSK